MASNFGRQARNATLAPPAAKAPSTLQFSAAETCISAWRSWTRSKLAPLHGPPLIGTAHPALYVLAACPFTIRFSIVPAWFSQSAVATLATGTVTTFRWVQIHRERSHSKRYPKTTRNVKSPDRFTKVTVPPNDAFEQNTLLIRLAPRPSYPEGTLN